MAVMVRALYFDWWQVVPELCKTKYELSTGLDKQERSNQHHHRIGGGLDHARSSASFAMIVVMIAMGFSVLVVMGVMLFALFVTGLLGKWHVIFQGRGGGFGPVVADALVTIEHVVGIDGLFDRFEACQDGGPVDGLLERDACCGFGNQNEKRR